MPHPIYSAHTVSSLWLQTSLKKLDTIVAAACPSTNIPLRPARVHSFSASYAGNIVYAPNSSTPLSVTVNKAATSIPIFLDASGSPSNSGQPVTFEASVQVLPPGSGDAQEPAGLLTFFDGQTVLGAAPIQNGSVNFTTSSLGVGDHSISAAYAGDSNLAGSTSPARIHTVNTTGGTGGTGGGGTGGGGTGGGGTGGGGGSFGSCGCAKTGNYVNPALPNEPAPDPATSPNGKYTVTATVDNANQQTSLVVTTAGKTVHFDNLPITTHWFFSPDEDRFVYRI